MHWENLAPLLPAAPFMALLAALLIGWLAMERLHRLRLQRQTEVSARRYWIAEQAYRARLRARAWLDRSRTPRLTYRPDPSDSEIAAELTGDCRDAMGSTSFPTRLARAKFRAWHRGTREADYTVGGFFDRYHAGWEEAELAWFEALLEQDDADILAWAMGQAEPPKRFQGPLMVTLQKLDFVTI